MLLAHDFEAAFETETSTSELAEWREAATKDEPAMHVKVTPKGCWHKLLVDRTRTACGKMLGAYATRDESYAGLLCEDGCFSPFELQLAADLRAADDAARYARQRDAEVDERLTREIAESRADNKRRLDIATGRHPKVDPADDLEGQVPDPQGPKDPPESK